MLRAQDVKSRVDLRTQVIEPDIGPGRRQGSWYVWRCPFHDDHHPSLKLKEGDPHYHCFACEAHGDVFDWLQERNGWDFNRALAHLAGLAGVDSAAETLLSRRAAGKEPAVLEPQRPDEGWQDKVRHAVEQRVIALWKTPKAQAELRGWGLLAETMRHWRLGWNDGKAGSRGIVIPHIAEGHIWGVKIRRYKGWSPDVDPKYVQVKGSKSMLFGADELRHDGRSLLLLEGEKDCLLAWQELRDIVDVATLAGATKRIQDRWMPYLLPYRRILLAYDADKAGDRGAKRLQELGSRFRRIAVPMGGDVVGFWQAQGDLQAWIAYELQRRRR